MVEFMDSPGNGMYYNFILQPWCAMGELGNHGSGVGVSH
jgi:hypothetical protein